MRFYKAAVLAFFTLLVFARSSFAGDNTSLVLSANSGFNKFFDITLSADTVQATNIYSGFAYRVEVGSDVVKKTVGLKKKKYKRIFSQSCTLRPLARELDTIAPNIYFKEIYSKPHFLSHLHRFLFRLTPF